MWDKIIITAEPLRKGISKLTGLNFEPGTDRNVAPARPLAAIADPGTGLRQINGHWGIRRPGYGSLITTADAARAAQQGIFSEALNSRRCLIPCTGWMERQSGVGNSCFRFTPSNSIGLLLAGLWFGSPSVACFVILTTPAVAKLPGSPTEMPLLLPPKKLKRWIDAPPSQVNSLLQSCAPVAIQSARAA